MRLPFRIKPIRFYPYTSLIESNNQCIVIHCDESKELMRDYQRLENELIAIFNASEIKAYPDNKTVFEVEIESGQRIAYSFYDWRLTIGFNPVTR